MIDRLRPWLGRLASIRTLATLTLAASTACNDDAESSVLRSDEPSRATAESPARSPESEAACTPAVSGLSPTGFEPIEVTCPLGYAHRMSLASPVAGRFTTLEQLTDAFCVPERQLSASAADARAPTADAPIDFSTSDVVAYAFDTHAGEAPALFDRGDELWLRTTTTTCSGEAPALQSIAFVVPKGREIREQRCSSTCR
ncbi:MAG: hypothetical protein KF894_16385 [Labilithrix sp.]|nr:hypothetical protein [Labilithrix sp.]